MSDGMKYGDVALGVESALPGATRPALRRDDVGPELRAHLKQAGWRAPGER